ncbi:MAG: diacylglycerol kinase family lipid kinase [Lachnospiraceae bacterium]|nr:diacylglycerol kinase family lipid kinase [Lachnospiraceae bacterium]
MGKKLLFIYNPKSGKGAVPSVLSDMIDIMVKSGFDITVRPTQQEKDAYDFTCAHAKEYDRIVACGGDGTLDEVVTAVMETEAEVEIGYIPAGSTNDFGVSLGIEGEYDKAARIAAGDKRFRCDVGSFNSDYFVYVAAFGIFTEVSYQTSQDLKNIFGHAAYLMEAIGQLADVPSFHMQVEYDGNIIEDDFIYGMITNSTSVGGIKGIVSGDISLDDGVFEVTLIRTPKNPLELSEIIGYLTSILKETALVYSMQTSELKISSEEEIPWTLDGEFGGKHDAVLIRNLPKAMEILVE